MLQSAKFINREEIPQEQAMAIYSRQGRNFQPRNFPSRSRVSSNTAGRSYVNNNSKRDVSKNNMQQNTAGCWRCGRLGHNKRECTAKTRVSYVDIDESVSHDQEEEIFAFGDPDQINCAYAKPVVVPVYAVKCENKDKGFVDSAALRNMCILIGDFLIN